MTHPGLPVFWVYIIWGFMLVLSVWAVLGKSSDNNLSNLRQSRFNLNRLTLLGPIIRAVMSSNGVLLLLKIIVLALFLLVIYAGLMGTPIPERNIATVLTWNIWWAGLIVSILFLGSAWCAVCPWDTLASWFVKPRLFFMKFNNSLELTPPKWMRSVWPALIMFIGLTWLELGYGVTASPYATALLSLLMVVMATVSLALFKNKAFCHYVCPVGRTIGFYSQLAPLELRPVDSDVCANCKTLECFTGTEKIDACPTQLVMGSLEQNTYCTSCGNCVQSCQKNNISWHLRPISVEAIHNARPHWDEAWFMLGLLTLTSFHGITMMEFWEGWIREFGRLIGDSGQLLSSFSIGLLLSMLIPISLYVIAVKLTRKLSTTDVSFKKVFSSLVFVTLPLAFAYHLAHNINHMIRESVGASQIFFNPLGEFTRPMELAENVIRQYNMLISENTLFTLQAALMMFGFWLALKVLRHRIKLFMPHAGWRLIPVLGFIMTINGFHLWMLMQPMIMRAGAMCIAPTLT